MKGTLLAKISVDAIENGPKWIPAKQNGHDVASYRLQPVTLSNPNLKPSSTDEGSTKKATVVNTAKVPGMVFTKLEKTATFPGGQSAWLKYISRVITQNGNELTANRDNYGTCKVRFIVDKNGKVSDIQATTMKGTKLAEVAVNAIKQGPDWIPGKQNGHIVNSYLIQPVSFALNDKMIKNEP
jgi:protein TonB